MTVAESSKKVMHRVLVVDDDHDLAELLREVLVYENCEVDVAPNGMEAMELLHARDYQAILCDLMMPRMDGEALYREVIRQFPYLADRFLFVTGQASRKAGFSDFICRTGNHLIEKPFEILELRNAVSDLFQR
ncbi:MAG TPA: response regulator [Verrucomicrobiae bacterium]|nr:response regulator [Verrucomicrobiae bacterium]